MPRYPEWFKRVGDGATHPGALDIGKKLLGYLAIRRQTPGVDTLVRRVKLDDGTVVEASFHGDQPRVIVYAADGQEACELYVESGMLDLGPNIASDANKRFNRGPPEFDDRPATLYFGDGVDCAPGQAGLNGKVRIDTTVRTLRSECLPKNGGSVESRLSDPAKKRAQAMLPASCWSGLMQRYVQAVYGGDALDYKASDSTLSIEGVPVGPIGNCVGLVRSDEKLQFVFAGSESVGLAPIKFKTACGKAAFQLWQGMQRRGDRDADKVLTVALSQIYPDAKNIRSAATFPTITVASPYGWQFAPGGAEAYVVGFDDRAGESVLYRLHVDGDECNVDEVERARMPPRESSVIISGPTRGPAFFGPAAHGTPLTEGDRFEYPIHCYYRAGELVTVYRAIDAGRAPPAAQDGTFCGGYTTGNTDVGGYDCGADPPRPADTYASHSPAQVGSPWFVTISDGLVGRAVSGVVWSTVRKTTAARIALRDTATGSITYHVVSRFIANVRTYLVHQNGEKTEPYDGSPVGRPYAPGQEPIRGADLSPEDPRCGRTSDKWECSDSDCASSCVQAISTNPAGMDYTYEYAPGTGCAASSFLLKHNITRTTTGTVTRACGTVESRYLLFIGVVGDTHELAIPMGDCAAVVAGVVRVTGSNYAVPGTAALQVLVGPECSAPAYYDLTTTWVCSGVGAPPADAHGPHTAESTFTGGYSGPFRRDHLVGVGKWVEREKSGAHCVSALSLQADATTSPPTAQREGAFTRPPSPATEKTWFAHDIDSPPDQTAQIPPELVTVIPQSGEACPLIYTLISPVDGTPIEVETPGGPKAIENRQLMTGSDGVLQRDAKYWMRRSLLGAATAPRDLFEFGRSVHMDRETITGGYPKVSTPSFVGWA